jgi:hypothetical protein
MIQLFSSACVAPYAVLTASFIVNFCLFDDYQNAKKRRISFIHILRNILAYIADFAEELAYRDNPAFVQHLTFSKLAAIRAAP